MKKEPDSRPIIRFGLFELDTSSGELRKSGVRVRVADQAIQVLTSLVDRPGEVVTREELTAVLWPAGTHVDFENGLNAAVKKLRIALGDSGVSPRYIETLPRRGYRLIVPVNPPEVLLPVGRPVPESPAGTGFRKRIYRIVTFAMSVGIVGAVVMVVTQRHMSETGSSVRPGWGQPSTNAEANGYFSKFELFLGVGTFDLARSRQLLQRALHLDPAFGKARAEYGFTNFLMVEAGYSNDPSWLDKAEEEIRQGLRDDPGFCHGYTSLGAVYLYRGQHESAMREIERALKINPADVDARHWLAVHHWHSGDSTTAEKLERENVARNPRFFPARMTLGAIALERGDWETSIRNYGGVLEYDAQNPFVLRLLTRAYLEIDDLANARHTLTRFRPEDHRSFPARALEALLLALEGKREAATNAMDAEVLKYLKLNRLWTLTGAEFYSVMGNRPQALDWLERAVRQGDNRVSWFARNSTLKAIRGELRYRHIVNLTRSTHRTK